MSAACLYKVGRIGLHAWQTNARCNRVDLFGPVRVNVPWTRLYAPNVGYAAWSEVDKSRQWSSSGIQTTRPWTADWQAHNASHMTTSISARLLPPSLPIKCSRNRTQPTPVLIKLGLVKIINDVAPWTYKFTNTSLPLITARTLSPLVRPTWANFLLSTLNTDDDTFKAGLSKELHSRIR